MKQHLNAEEALHACDNVQVSKAVQDGKKTDIRSLTLEELAVSLGEMGQPKFRAKQVFSWIHEKQASSFEEMSNLPANLRQTLTERYYISLLKIVRKLQSQLDSTVKYLLELRDGSCVEAVLMQYKHGLSLCISTQVGCRMGCKFCASTLGGLVRGLEPGEMLGEIYTIQCDSCISSGIQQKISTVVLMGIGEPLDNYDNVLKFLKLLSEPEGYALSLRHVSLSTCGIVPRIYDLANERLGLTLSISLHAPNNNIRSTTMPVNQKWNVEELLQACQDYFHKTGRRISFEYALIEGVNDEMSHARELADRLGKMGGVHINLIPVNPVEERGYRRGSRQRVEAFRKVLEERGLNATVRRELGADINAACGQLRKEQSQNGFIVDGVKF